VVAEARFELTGSKITAAAKRFGRLHHKLGKIGATLGANCAAGVQPGFQRRF
jgi:hypothetical protein